MSIRCTTFATLAFTLAGTGLGATDFGPLMDVAKATWPEKTHYAVVANYRHSQEEIQALAWAVGAGKTITVMDVSSRADVERASRYLASQVKPDCLVLIPTDPVFFDSSEASTRVVRRIAAKGIPTIATRPVAIGQGAVFARGAGTGLELLVNPRTIGTIDVILPARGTFVNTAASRWQPEGPAEIRLLAALR